MNGREQRPTQLGRLWRYLRPYQVSLILATLFISLQVVADLLASHFLGKALDTGLMADQSSFLCAFHGLLVTWLLADVAFYIRYQLARRTAEKMVYDVRQAATSTLCRALTSELEQKHSGDFISRLSSDIDLMKGLVAQEWVNLVRGGLGFLGALIMMLAISWRLTLAVLVTVPIISFVANKLSKPLGQHITNMQARLAAVNALAQDSLAGIIVSKAFNLREYLGGRFHASNQQVADEAVQVATFRGLLSGSMMALTLMPVFVLFGLGGYEVIMGRLTLGKLLVMVNLLNNLTWPLNQMARSLAQAKAGLVASERVFEVLALPVERSSGSELSISKSVPYAIELENLYFAYDPAKQVFTGLNLQITTGEKVAIVGASGSGKSTLFSLLLGFRQPQSGNIRFFGQNFDQLSLSSVRKAIAYVPQEALLFPTSVAQNIAYGDLNRDTGAVRQVAAIAAAHDFIDALPDSYDTHLGEYGTGISGGQKQRISLARAILKDAPILLLDEATSALDTESEAHVQQAIQSLSQGHTTVIIAHRLSTIKDVDRIVVLDQGVISEIGTHAELLQAGGLYARLYAQQFANEATSSAVAVGN